MRRLLLLLAFLLGAEALAAEKVDLALVLAVDVSGSIDAEEFLLQRNGYADAFRDPRLIAAMMSGRERRVAVTMLEWAGASGQTQAIPWTLVDSRDTSRALADKIQRTPRQVFGGLGVNGIRVQVGSVRQVDFRVIDVQEGHGIAFGQLLGLGGVHGVIGGGGDLGDDVGAGP